MKILHVTDLHFHAPWFHWVSRQARDYDVVALSGDLLDRFNPTPRERQIAWVSAWLRQAEVPLVVCSGNHDEEEEPDAGCPWLRACSIARTQLVTDRQLHRHGRWTFEAVPFGGLPLRGGEHHVVVTHLPPAGAPTAWLRSLDFEDGDLRLARHLKQTVERPRLILSGHVHDPRSWRARCGRLWSFNPGGAPSAHPEVPHHIALDLAARTAGWRDGWGRHDQVHLG